MQEVVEEGAEQAAKREAKNALQEQGKKVANRTSGNNPYAQRGRQVHEEFKKKAKQKGWDVEKTLTDPDTGKKCRPDAITPKGHPVELKPNTPSGRRRGKKQMEKYERAMGKRGRVIYYNP